MNWQKWVFCPGREKSFYESGDYFEGTYETIRFRASTVETHESDNSALTVFDGQVIVFSTFHAFKTSETGYTDFPQETKWEDERIDPSGKSRNRE